MTKEQFLNSLGKALGALSTSEREKTLAYYSEIIDDRMENGMSEEEAVSGFESPTVIADGILADANITPDEKKPTKLLLILGSPLWIPLLIAAASVVFSLYITLWSLIIAYISIWVSFATSTIACLIIFFATLSENSSYAFFSLGGAFLMGGLTVCSAASVKYVVSGAAGITKRSFIYLTEKLTGKDGKVK